MNEPVDQLLDREDYWVLAVAGARLRGTGKWEQHTYAGPPGSRRYFVYTPANYTIETRVPLVLMLHGCTQTPNDSAAGTEWNQLADQRTFVVVYPEQTRKDNASSCWNWFLSTHQERGSAEAGVLAGITQQVLASDTRWNIDPDRVYVVGLSAGAAMSAILGATYPDLFAAIGVHSGLEYQAATDLVSALNAMRQGGPDPTGQGGAAFAAMGVHARLVPTIVFHGTRDRTVNPNNGDQVVQQWMETNRLASDSYEANFDHPSHEETGVAPGGLRYETLKWNDEDGNVVQEYWKVEGLDHAWSGGSAIGSFSDPRGPDATEAIFAFFSSSKQ